MAANSLNAFRRAVAEASRSTRRQAEMVLDPVLPRMTRRTTLCGRFRRALVTHLTDAAQSDEMWAELERAWATEDWQGAFTGKWGFQSESHPAEQKLVVVPALANVSNTANVFVVMLTELRNCVRHGGLTAPVRERALTLLSAPQSVYDERARQADSKRLARNADQHEVQWPRFHEQVTNEWLPCARAGSRLHALLVVVAATGMRRGEVLASHIRVAGGGGDLTLPPGEWVVQVGVLKDRSRPRPDAEGEHAQLRARATEMLRGAGGQWEEGQGGRRVVIKPVLLGITAREVVDLVGLVRSGTSLLTGANAVVKQAFPEVAARAGGRLGTHFLRAVYANAAYAREEPRLRMSRNTFMSRVLGHDQRNLDTALNYSSVALRVGEQKSLN